MTDPAPSRAIAVECGCPGRRVPIHVAREFLRYIRLVMHERLPTDLPALTYRCPRCKSIIVITAADIFLS